MIASTQKRVLVVEDEVLVAMDIEDLLAAMGHHVVGPAIRLREAMELARGGDIDFAVLDVNLAGTPSFPVAAILRALGIPFLFATGYGNQGIPEEYRNAPTLQKPYAAQDLERAIAAGLTVDRLVA